MSLDFTNLTNALKSKFTLKTDFNNHTSNINNPHTVINPQLGNGFGTCDTAENTIAKVVSLDNFQLKNGGIIGVRFTHSVLANSTLNINSTGAKPIYHNGLALKSGVILSEDIAFFIYDGSRFNLLSDRLISGTTIKTVQDRSLLGSGNVSILESELVRRSFTVLNETISGARSGETIYLTGFYDFTSETDSIVGGITIDKDLTIIGVDCTIDAHQLARAFNITSGAVTIQNVKFNNCTAYNGGAIHGDVRLINCEFSNCVATNDGGAIHGVVNCIDCSFSRCSSISNGGAIRCDAESYVSNCTFNSCTAYNGGAICHYGRYSRISCCNFNYNSATRGGAIYLDSIDHAFDYTWVYDCNFVYNRADYGGAIYVYNTQQITNCSFLENGSSDSSDAIYVYTYCNVYSCKFKDDDITSVWGQVDEFGDLTSNINITNSAFLNTNSGYSSPWVNNGNNCYNEGDSYLITNSQVDSKLSGKANSSHNHGWETIVDGKASRGITGTITLTVNKDIKIARIYFNITTSKTLTKGQSITVYTNATYGSVGGFTSVPLRKQGLIMGITYAGDLIIDNLFDSASQSTGTGSYSITYAYR